VTTVETIRSLVVGAEAAELPTIAGELARGLAVVLTRLAAPSPIVRTSKEESRDLLTVDEAAERLGVPSSWLYRHAKELPFTRKLGYRTLRFYSLALERWMDSRGTLNPQRESIRAVSATTKEAPESDRTPK